MQIVSMIGQRPIAELQAILSWSTAQQRAPGRILLVDSVMTARAGIGVRVRNRLKRMFAEARLGTPEVSLVEAPTTIEGVLAVIRAWSRENESMLFCCQPGLGYLGPPIYQAMPSTTRLLFNRFDDVCCGRAGSEQIETAPLLDLGVRNILNVYGVKVQVPQVPTAPFGTRVDQLGSAIQGGKVLVGVQLMPPGMDGDLPRKPVTLDLLWEHRGRLFGAIVAGPRWDRETAHEVLQRLGSLGALEIETTLASDDSALRERWRWRGNPTSGASPQALDTLVRRVLNAPLRPRRAVRFARNEAHGRVSEGSSPLPRDAGTAEPEFEHVELPERVQGTDDIPEGARTLACWMGEDPIPTLLVLATHAPRRALVFYDATHPRVRLNCARLAGLAAPLIGGAIEFLPSDDIGSGVHAAIAQRLAPDEALDVNVTPGAKVQGLALATCEAAQVHLWSMDNRALKAKELGGRRELRYAPVSLLTRAFVHAGPLRAQPDGERAPTPAEQASTWAGIAAITDWAADSRRRNTRPQGGWSRRKGGTWYAEDVNGEQKLRISSHIPSGRQRPPPVTLDWPRGAWLEQLMAGALATVCTDVRRNLEWAWARSDFPIAEADVVAMHGNTVYVFECKTADGDYAIARRQALTIAEACFGRFAIPVVIRGYIVPKKRTAMSERDVPVLSLADFSGVDKTRQTLDWLRSRRSTLQ